MATTSSSGTNKTIGFVQVVVRLGHPRSMKIYLDPNEKVKSPVRNAQFVLDGDGLENVDELKTILRSTATNYDKAPPLTVDVKKYRDRGANP